MIRGACTIVSSNYLAYARTLADSFRKFHPEYRFIVLLVDRLPPGFDATAEPFELVLVEDLAIPNFPQIAFKFGVVELNTNVKPTFLKMLLDAGIDELIYFDPDILLYASAETIYEQLSTNAVLLTPHSTSPSELNVYDEVLQLVNGTFNLGFIACSNTPEAHRFLQWWESRCLALGYNERWAGLFADQKWVNLAPCYFDSVKILKEIGCNVAYWNLHERSLTRSAQGWVVNGTSPLIFFHFSGVSADDTAVISKHSDTHDLESRPDLREIFRGYRNLLIAHGVDDARGYPYAFGYFDNGKPINRLQRALFAANLDRFGSADPFAASGPFYRWATRMHLQSTRDSVHRFGRKAYRTTDPRVRLINGILRLLVRVLGADRYTVLMKYLEYISVLRNQKDIFK